MSVPSTKSSKNDGEDAQAQPKVSRERRMAKRMQFLKQSISQRGLNVEIAKDQIASTTK